MPRLNIEDQFWLDITSVAIKMGTEDGAIGNAVRFFRYAQERHKRGEYISEEDFKSNNFSEALFPKFAQRTEQGIQVTGAETYFGWLKQKVDAGRKGGLKGGKERVKNSLRDEKGRLKPQSESRAKLATPDPLPLPLPLPLSHAHAQKTYSVGEQVAKAPAQQNPIQMFVGSFVRAYETKFKVRPDLKDGRLLGEIKRFVNGYQDINRACELIQVYYQMTDPWFETKKWDFTTFSNNLAKVSLALDTGEQLTKNGADEWLSQRQKSKSKDVVPA